MKMNFCHIILSVMNIQMEFIYSFTFNWQNCCKFISQNIILVATMGHHLILMKTICIQSHRENSNNVSQHLCGGGGGTKTKIQFVVFLVYTLQLELYATFGGFFLSLSISCVALISTVYFDIYVTSKREIS